MADDRLQRFAASVAKGAHLGVYRDALAALDRAEAAGVPYADAAPGIASTLATAWAPTGPSTALTFDNAAQQATDLGRIEALQADAARRPWWYFSAVGDEDTSEVCSECDGTLLPASHPWWARHIPSLHLRCRSAIVAATAAQAAAMGGATAAPAVEADEGFGTVADLCSWEPLPGQYPAELHEAFFPSPSGKRANADAGASHLLADPALPSDAPMPNASPAKPTKPITAKQRREARVPAKRVAADAAAVKLAGLSTVRRRGLHMRIGLASDGGHTVEVMHAADADGVVVRGEGCEIALLARDAPPAPVWNQLTKLGAWRGHPAGPFEITRATNAEILRNFKATVNQRIPVDFEHASEADGTAGSIPVEGAPAQGWIVDLDDRGAAGLWGLVEWGERARSYILDGSYRFFSPAIRFGSKDRETGRPIGARMTSGALVNIPFLDGLMPLAAADRTGAAMLNRPLLSPDFIARMRVALRCGDTDPLDRMAAKCADLRDLCATMGEDMMSQGVSMAPYLSDLQALMAMPAHSSIGDLLDAVEEMIEAAIERHEATYHAAGPVGPSDDDGPPSAPMGQGQMQMSDTDKALAVQLGEEKQRAATVTAERDVLAGERASLTLRLKDAESKASEATIALADRDAQIVALRSQIDQRDAAEHEAAITLAFDTYKDARKLTDDDKAAMRVVLKADRALFAKLYPAVAPNQRHLMADLTGRRDAGTTTSTAPAGPSTASRGMSPDEQRLLSDKYRKEGMSLEDATNRAYSEAKASERSARGQA